MELPNAYTIKPNSIPVYFETILQAQAPQRFSQKFLESLGFKSTNDRLIIGILKELGFLDSDGAPTQRYFEYLDRSRSARVLAEAIEDMYAGLFAINTEAYNLSYDEVKNKLRTLYAGSKTDNIIERIARTFVALVQEADFSQSQIPPKIMNSTNSIDNDESKSGSVKKSTDEVDAKPISTHQELQKDIGLKSLQYHINIVLPESREQSVYDAIFRSLREHLG